MVHPDPKRRWTTIELGRSLWPLLAALAFGNSASALTVVEKNLVSDPTSAIAAQVPDPNLKNAWGISFGGSSPFWISDNRTHVSTLYSVNPTTDKTLVSASTGRDYERAAIGTVGGTTYIYAANHDGGIDVIKGTNGSIGIDTTDFAGKFVDGDAANPISAAFKPYNIQNLDGALYATYSNGGGTGGYVDKFDLVRNYLGRVASNGVLNDPWGLTIAPASFGSLGRRPAGWQPWGRQDQRLQHQRRQHDPRTANSSVNGRARKATCCPSPTSGA